VADFRFLKKSTFKNDLMTKEFVYIRRREPGVHPELNLVLYVLENHKVLQLKEGEEVYISASKDCCEQCYNIIKKINFKFKTRENSGKHYAKYPIPKKLTDYLENSTIEEIVNSENEKGKKSRSLIKEDATPTFTNSLASDPEYFNEFEKKIQNPGYVEKNEARLAKLYEELGESLSKLKEEREGKEKKIILLILNKQT